MSEAAVRKKLYLIERTGDGAEYRYYAEHGEVGGVSDAIGYETDVHAKKFRTEGEAQEFLRTQFPEWGRGLHRAVGMDFTGSFEAAGLAALFRFGTEIPDHLLEPTPGRLRVWRR